MTTEELEQIGKIVDERVSKQLEPINKRLDSLHDGQSHLASAIEAVKAGQDDMRDKMATQADMMDLGAKINRITRNHERRLEELEGFAGLTNPHKN